MQKCNVILFADQEVGLKVLDHYLEKYNDDLLGVVLNGDQKIFEDRLKNKINPEDIFCFSKGKEKELLKFLSKYEKIDYCILAWWPFIIKKEIIDLPKVGIINFHPSLLPYNKGKNYNFWTLIENSPFGVTLHFVNESIDGGDIIFQREIHKDWTDTGETLYHKAKNEIYDLFITEYQNIRTKNYVRIPQQSNKGSFHLEKEMFEKSKINLEDKYMAKDLINLLRAKSFPPHPGVIFEDGEKTYEIKIEIKEIKK